MAEVIDKKKVLAVVNTEAQGNWDEIAFLRGYRVGYQDGMAAGQAGKIPQPEILDLPVEALGLSVRPRNCLRAYGCERIADVVRLPKTVICRMRGLGKKSADEIARSLHKQGIFSVPWDDFLL